MYLKQSSPAMLVLTPTKPTAPQREFPNPKPYNPLNPKP